MVNVTILPICRYKKEKEDPLPAAHSLHMVLNAVLSSYGAPLVDFQVLMVLQHISYENCMKMIHDKGMMQLEYSFTKSVILWGA